MHLRTLLVALALVAASLGGAPAGATQPSDDSSSVASAQPPSHVDRRVPDLTTIRSCIVSIRTLGECAVAGLVEPCIVTYSALAKCITKIYGYVRTAQKILDFRSDPRCPGSLSVLADYICAPRVPPAPRTVLVQVENSGQGFPSFTGPSRAYPRAYYYADGALAGVVCLALFGEPVTRGTRSDTGWSRLSNGTFLPRIVLRAVGTPGNVPYC